MTGGAEATPGPEATDRFLHLTDLHFWRVEVNPFRLLNKRIIGNTNVIVRRRHEFRIDEAQRFAKDIAALGIPDVLITGDFASTATDAEFQMGRDFVESLVRLGMHPVVIAGNHDVYTFEAARRRRFERYLGEWLPADRFPAVRQLGGGTPMLFVPTVCPNIITSRGRITPEEVEAVRRSLEGLDPPIVVAGHYPLLNETYGYVMNPNRRMRNAEALRRAIGESEKSTLYVSGHVHRFSYVRDPDFPSLEQLTTGALFRRDKASGYAGDLSEIRVTPDGFRVFRHQFAGAWSVTEHTAREMAPA